MLKFKTAVVAAAIVLAFTLVCSVQKAQAQEYKIGVFYLSKVLEDSKKGKDASKQLDTKYESTKKTLDTKAKNFQKKDQDLAKAKATLSEDAFNKRRDDLAKEYAALMEESQKAGADFEKAREQAMLPLYQKISNVVGDVAKSRGYAYVFEVQNGGVYFHPESVDITADVIKGVDK
ncbi:MAG: OmpH family outer membrane protein [Deltaproteobacteria bacterium]|jgi:outer membrane protein|nr:OmpH family outer membrane protein [Deltaproteobacteria bacterium]